jgi:hypothetical protein
LWSARTRDFRQPTGGGLIELFMPFELCHIQSVCRSNNGWKGVHFTLATHRTLSLCRVLLYPLEDAVLETHCQSAKRARRAQDPHHVKVVSALPRHCKLLTRHSKGQTPPRQSMTLTEAAVIAWVFARRTRAIKVDLADAAHIVFGYVPSPGSDGIPLRYLDFHSAGRRRCLVLALKSSLQVVPPHSKHSMVGQS